MSTIAEIKQLIAEADMCGHVPLVEGVHGIGKSESAAQYAKENNMHYEPLILSLMDTGDMLGLPVTRNVGGLEATVWAAPSWYINIVNAAWPMTLELDQLQFIDDGFQQYLINNLKNKTAHVERAELNELYCTYYELPQDTLQILRQNNVYYLKGRRSLLNLDEFNRAPADILNASLQLILDHRLHSHILPTVHGKETLIVAAVNPAGSNYTVQEFDPALLDRFVMSKAEPDFQAWLPWAREKNTNKIVVDFLLENYKKFHMVPEDGTKGTSPRSWTRLATYMDRIQDNNMDLNPAYVIGTIGSALGAQFIQFFNSYSTSMNYKQLSTAIKKGITKAKRKGDINVEELAEEFADIVNDMDAVRRGEFAETFIADYIKNTDSQKALPMLVYMYALPMESLSAVLKSLQTSSIEDYTQLAIIDKEINGKRLFIKLTSNLKGT